ncbi:hypothetical protein, partial [Nevskia sp.]|uniref:hypothetical protein n=1 Tax=Nevskia sp. TaxID=1929292 RepID=UPI0025F4BEDA
LTWWGSMVRVHSRLPKDVSKKPRETGAFLLGGGTGAWAFELRCGLNMKAHLFSGTLVPYNAALFRGRPSVVPHCLLIFGRYAYQRGTSGSPER